MNVRTLQLCTLKVFFLIFFLKHHNRCSQSFQFIVFKGNLLRQFRDPGWSLIYLIHFLPNFLISVASNFLYSHMRKLILFFKVLVSCSKSTRQWKLKIMPEPECCWIVNHEVKRKGWVGLELVPQCQAKREARESEQVHILKSG